MIWEKRWSFGASASVASIATRSSTGVAFWSGAKINVDSVLYEITGKCATFEAMGNWAKLSFGHIVIL